MGRVISWFFFIFAIVMSVSMLTQCNKARHLIMTKGNILELGFGLKADYIGKGGREYRISVRYSYMVNGQRFESEKLRLDGNGFTLRSNVENIIADLRRKPLVDVWYDPEQPQYAVLYPVISAQSYTLLAVFLILGILSRKYLDNLVKYVRGKCGKQD